MPVYTTRETLTVDATAGGVALTTATIKDSGQAVLTLETAPIRYTVDGTAPTATIGHLAQPGDVIHLENRDELRKFRAIRTTGLSATLMASYGMGGPPWN